MSAKRRRSSLPVGVRGNIGTAHHTPGRWYGGSAVFGAVLMCVLLAWAFHTALGSRSPWPGVKLED